MKREMTGGRVLLRIAGRFDPASALLLERELVKEDETEEVVLDFASVDELGDASVAVLSHVLPSAPSRSLRVCGLRRHHQRLLRYLSIELDEHGRVRCENETR